jgi:hypothetical protein
MSAFRAVVGPPGTTAVDGTLVLVPGNNLRTGVEDLLSKYSECTSLEADILTVASAIYACDLAFKRGEREEITRSIELEIPVINQYAFDKMKVDLELLLWTLSHDNWTITFVRADGAPEAKHAWPQNKGLTILFSGGVDSFAAALNFLASKGLQAVQLASHVTANPVTRQSQDDLATYLSTRFSGAIERLVVRSGGRKKGEYSFPSDTEREETQRTRSFMFLAIAAVAARRSGHRELVIIAENGQLAIHLPLSVARVGAFSTHTAHPEFVVQAAAFFSAVLDFPLEVTNPFLYKTKAEVVASISDQDRPALGACPSNAKSAVMATSACGSPKWESQDLAT